MRCEEYVLGVHLITRALIALITRALQDGFGSKEVSDARAHETG